MKLLNQHQNHYSVFSKSFLPTEFVVYGEFASSISCLPLDSNKDILIAMISIPL